ncbi:actin-related protein [Crucibulum laeve]|uniref:Actin-related protein n=1 Tax=Crucibulum laeve TaxID=68775 RepID=A0A5C3M3S3_9AGAR|nr:actin-related protein [Crucibulum laeve]
MSIRDANVVIIETSRTVVRGGLGLFDLLKTPSIEIQARVGLRRNAFSENTNGEANGAEEASTSRAQSSKPIAAVHDYLVGSQLDDALAAGQDIVVSWPFAEGDVSDYTQAEAIWKHILFTQLQRRRVQNESPVLLSLPSGLPRSSYERVCQIFFERFNVAGFGILERPMAQLYAANALSGVVVDIGHEYMDITPIYDGFIVHSARTTTPLGLRHCQAYLAHLLRSNQGLIATISPPTAPLSADELHKTLLALIQELQEAGHIKVPSDGETAAPEDEGITDIAAVVVAGKERAVIESGMKKKATAKASAAEQARAREIEALDLITVDFREKNVTLGKERHRLCEPLFDPELLEGVPGLEDLAKDKKGDKPLSLQDAAGHAVGQTEIDQRQYIWQGLFVTGDVTRHVKGIGIALQSRLAPFISNPDLLSDVQARSIRLLSVPEYYAEYRETGNGFAAFLGGSIVAKITFNDNAGRSFVSKAEYAAKGPHAIIEMTPSLL